MIYMWGGADVEYIGNNASNIVNIYINCFYISFFHFSLLLQNEEPTFKDGVGNM